VTDDFSVLRLSTSWAVENDDRHTSLQRTISRSKRRRRDP
jgi:hypothetical protein